MSPHTNASWWPRGVVLRCCHAHQMACGRIGPSALRAHRGAPWLPPDRPEALRYRSTCCSHSSGWMDRAHHTLVSHGGDLRVVIQVHPLQPTGQRPSRHHLVPPGCHRRSGPTLDLVVGVACRALDGVAGEAPAASPPVDQLHRRHTPVLHAGADEDAMLHPDPAMGNLVVDGTARIRHTLVSNLALLVATAGLCDFSLDPVRIVARHSLHGSDLWTRVGASRTWPQWPAFPNWRLSFRGAANRSSSTCRSTTIPVHDHLWHRGLAQGPGTGGCTSPSGKGHTVFVLQDGADPSRYPAGVTIVPDSVFAITKEMRL